MFGRNKEPLGTRYTPLDRWDRKHPDDRGILGFRNEPDAIEKDQEVAPSVSRSLTSPTVAPVIRSSADRLRFSSGRPESILSSQQQSSDSIPGMEFTGAYNPGMPSEHLRQIMVVGALSKTLEALQPFSTQPSEVIGVQPVPYVAPRTSPSESKRNAEKDPSSKRPSRKRIIIIGASALVLSGAAFVFVDPLDNFGGDKAEAVAGEEVESTANPLAPTVERPGVIETLDKHYVATTELTTIAQTRWDFTESDQEFDDLYADPSDPAAQELFQLEVPNYEVQWVISVPITEDDTTAVTQVKPENSTVTNVTIDMAKVQLRAQVNPRTYQDVTTNPEAIGLFAALNENSEASQAISEALIASGAASAEQLLRIPAIYSENLPHAVHQVIAAGIDEIEDQLLETVQQEIIASFGLDPNLHDWEFINEDKFAVEAASAAADYSANYPAKDVIANRVRLVTESVEGGNPLPVTKIEQIILPEGQVAEGEEE